jgi:hypothetical protein
MQKEVYTVIVDGNDLKCIDTSNGMIVSVINILGDIVSGPIVTDDRCTIVFNDNGARRGRVYKIPSFALSSSFDA